MGDQFIILYTLVLYYEFAEIILLEYAYSRAMHNTS